MANAPETALINRTVSGVSGGVTIRDSVESDMVISNNMALHTRKRKYTIVSRHRYL